MSLVTELFGTEILTASLSELKEKIKQLPDVQKERYAYLLKDYAKIKGITLTKEDFDDVLEVR